MPLAARILAKATTPLQKENAIGSVNLARNFLSSSSQKSEQELRTQRKPLQQLPAPLRYAGVRSDYWGFFPYRYNTINALIGLSQVSLRKSSWF